VPAAEAVAEAEPMSAPEPEAVAEASPEVVESEAPASTEVSGDAEATA
jgi:hypothetical protein